MALTSDTTVGLLARLAADFPEQIAFSNDDTSRVTCSELWIQLQTLASALVGFGVRGGDRVAICLPNCLEWTLWEYASQALAAIPVGIGVQWSKEHVNDVLSHCGATVVVVENEAALRGFAATTLDRCRLICTLEPSGMDPGRRSYITHRELMDRGRHATALVHCTPADPATIIYTSGSTGRPKGIMHTHGRVMAAVAALAGYYPELEGGRLALGWLPMEHLYQRIFNLVSLAFVLETRMVRDVGKLVTLLGELRPSYFTGVPFVYEQLLYAMERSPRDFVSWQRELRLMIIGAAPTGVEMLDRLAALGLPVRQAYSTSECLVPIACNTLSDNRTGSVGRPHPSYDLRISDAGEISVKGPGVFTGYVGDEERASSLFDAEGYFSTGDFGYLDQDGYLYVTGWREDFFKTSTGRRISPFEVESAYKRAKLIEHVIVVGHGRKHLVALVQLQSSAAEALAAKLELASADHEQWSRDERMNAAV
ncbi:MAG TPA: AMP-binding protein, partial [Polyangiaceae bacterium]|nr:AMP-binding protein [Polyangiaceae bacterium]